MLLFGEVLFNPRDHNCGVAVADAGARDSRAVALSIFTSNATISVPSSGFFAALCVPSQLGRWVMARQPLPSVAGIDPLSSLSSHFYRARSQMPSFPSAGDTGDGPVPGFSPRKRGGGALGEKRFSQLR